MQATHDHVIISKVQINIIKLQTGHKHHHHYNYEYRVKTKILRVYCVTDFEVAAYVHHKTLLLLLFVLVYLKIHLVTTNYSLDNKLLTDGQTGQTIEIIQEGHGP